LNKRFQAQIVQGEQAVVVVAVVAVVADAADNVYAHRIITKLSRLCFNLP
jgi:hypothetical protein